jgi:hypothetical protein
MEKVPGGGQASTPRLWLACFFSPTGFPLSPAAGLLLMADGRPDECRLRHVTVD